MSPRFSMVLFATGGTPGLVVAVGGSLSAVPPPASACSLALPPRRAVTHSPPVPPNSWGGVHACGVALGCPPRGAACQGRGGSLHVFALEGLCLNFGVGGANLSQSGGV